MNEAIAFRVAPGLFPVDARIISLDDLYEMIEYVESVPLDNWSAKNRRIAVGEMVLTFFGGLRRTEGLGLERRDFLPGLMGEVLVRENKDRSRKAIHAGRC